MSYKFPNPILHPYGWNLKKNIITINKLNIDSKISELGLRLYHT